MTASSQEPVSSPQPSPATKPAAPVPPTRPSHDIIPVPLIIAIFAVVVALSGYLLKDNWGTDMARYRSIRAQVKQDYPTAIENLKKLIASGEAAGNAAVSKSPTYLSEIGYSYSQMKQYPEALKYYQLAQENRANMGNDDQGNPRPPADFQSQIGYVQFQMGDLDAAAKSLQGALQYNKLDALANYTMGELAMKQGNYIKAADYFKVVSDNPTYEARVKDYYAQIETKLFSGIS